MEKKEKKDREKGLESKKLYVKPEVIASYEEDELEKILKPRGGIPSLRS